MNIKKLAVEFGSVFAVTPAIVGCRAPSALAHVVTHG